MAPKGKFVERETFVVPSIRRTFQSSSKFVEAQWFHFFPVCGQKILFSSYLCGLCWLTVHYLHYCNNKGWFFGKYINFKPLLKTVMFCVLVIYEAINPLSANPRKWSNTFKQFIGNLSTDSLSMLDHFVELALTELREVLLWWYTNSCTVRNKNIFLISGIPPSVSF